MEVSIKKIQQIVAETMNLTIQEFTQTTWSLGSQTRRKVAARQLSMYFCVMFSNQSYQQIGVEHGGRDHSTVTCSVRVVNNAIDTGTNKVILDNYYAIKNAIGEFPAKSRPVNKLERRITKLKIEIQGIPVERRHELLMTM